MKKVIKEVEKLKKSSIKRLIKSRIQEFSYFKSSSSNEIFLELCFCFMTANFQAQKSWDIQKEIGLDFLRLSEKELQNKIKQKGHRFWPQAGSRIYHARFLKNNLYKKLKENKEDKDLRFWIVKTFKGIGMKEASHFLRNIGYENLAIIDKHIVNLLVEEKLINRPKTLTIKKYLEIEKILEKLSKKVNLKLNELDLYLWYLETGKILK